MRFFEVSLVKEVAGAAQEKEFQMEGEPCAMVHRGKKLSRGEEKQHAGQAKAKAAKWSGANSPGIGQRRHEVKLPLQ